VSTSKALKVSDLSFSTRRALKASDLSVSTRRALKTSKGGRDCENRRKYTRYSSNSLQGLRYWLSLKDT